MYDVCRGFLWCCNEVTSLYCRTVAQWMSCRVSDLSFGWTKRLNTQTARNDFSLQVNDVHKKNKADGGTMEVFCFTILIFCILCIRKCELGVLEQVDLHQMQVCWPFTVIKNRVEQKAMLMIYQLTSVLWPSF